MRKIPDPIRAGLVTAGFTFLVTFLGAVTGWMADVYEWASSDGTVTFPELSTLKFALFTAVVSAATGVVNTVYRWAQEALGLGTPPVYPQARSGGAAVVGRRDRWMMMLGWLVPVYRSAVVRIERPGEEVDPGLAGSTYSEEREQVWWEWAGRRFGVRLKDCNCL